MNTPYAWDVYLVTDQSFSKGRSTLEIVEAALAGGVSLIQLREKGMNSKALYEEGMKIREMLKRRDVPLIVNDRLDIALAIEADGVHLGQKDIPVDVARRILGPRLLIGISVEHLADMDDKTVQCADYLALSPLFATSTKTDTGTPWGLDGIAQARARTDLPIVAIGSIHEGNARDVVAAGADCVAVVTAIVSADDPAEATRRLVREVRAGKLSRGCRQPLCITRLPRERSSD